MTPASTDRRSPPADAPGDLASGLRGVVLRAPPPPPLYRLGLVLVAAAMLLLVLCYAGLAVGLAAAAVVSVRRMSAPDPDAVSLLRIAAVTLGPIVIVFLMKPLLVRRRANGLEPRLISSADEPRLRVFIEQLARCLNAPVPREIRVDDEANAAAGVRPGLGSVLSRDCLVLTIGLPLVGGLGLREFAGVLAHELGHFSQRGGLRLAGLIRAINHWFARLVYGRDGWDLSLARAPSTWSHAHFGVAMVVMTFVTTARFMTWLTRRVFWALMMLGHMVSCFFTRRMEHDADWYEVAIAGSSGFAATTERIALLDFARARAYADVARAWLDRRLPDDLVALILAAELELEPEARDAALERVRRGATGVFDTHPSSRARIERAQQQDAAGLLQTDLPATALFSDLPLLSRAVTLELFRSLVGPEVKEEDLHPAAGILRQQAHERRAALALGRAMQGGAGRLRWPALPAAIPPPSVDLQEVAAQLRGLRARLLAGAPEYREVSQAYVAADQRAVLARQAEALARAGFTPHLGFFQIDDPSIEGTAAARQDALEELAELARRLAPFEATFSARIGLAVSLLGRGGTAAPNGGRGARVEAEVMLTACTQVAAVMPALTAMVNDAAALGLLLQQEQTFLAHPLVQGACANLLAGLMSVQTTLARTPHPLSTGSEQPSLAEEVLPELPEPYPAEVVCATVETTFTRCSSIYARCVGRLALLAEEAEASVGLERLPDPPRATSP